MTVEVRLYPGALDRLLYTAEGPLGRFLTAEGRAMELVAKQECPVDEAKLRATISSKVVRSPRGLSLRLSAGGPGAPHAMFVHQGTRPHWPPIAALVGWAQRHGFPNAYLVARAIAQHGTRGVPFLLRAVQRRFPNAHPIIGGRPD